MPCPSLPPRKLARARPRSAAGLEEATATGRRGRLELLAGFVLHAGLPGLHASAPGLLRAAAKCIVRGALLAALSESALRWRRESGFARALA